MILFLLGLVGALFGFGGVAEIRSNERSAANSFHEHLGQEADVRVRMKLSGIASLHGDLAGVNVTVTNFQLAGLPWSIDPTRPRDGRIKRLDVHLVHGTAKGYRVDRIDLTVPEIRYDFRAARHRNGFILSDAKEGSFRLELSEETAAADALQKNKSLSEVKVIIDQGRMTVTAKAKSGFGNLPVRIDGRVEERDGHLVMLEDPTVTLNGKPLGPESAKAILGTINPLIDLDQDFGQPSMFTLRSVAANDHRLVLFGTLRLPTKSPEKVGND